MISRFLPLPKPWLAAASLLAFLQLTTSCTKVVDLNLQETAPRLMIEGNLANDGQPCTVRLSTSANYNETNTFAPEAGAVITLSDDAGPTETLREVTPGQYQGTRILGQVGHRYTLRVEAAGASYVAQSVLPAEVPLTGLHIEKSNFGDNLQVVPDYQDPAGVRNYYLFRQYRNSRLNKALFVRSDDLTDGKANTQALSLGGADNADKLVAGDSVHVEMQTVDAGVYEYLRTLAQTLQAVGSPTPANPKTNFSGNVLGYFSAHTVQRRSIVVP